MEQHDIPQIETIQPETLKALYNNHKIKFIINYHSECSELAVRNLIHLNQLKETTNKLNIVDKDTLRKIRPGREKSPLQSLKPIIELKAIMESTARISI